LARAGVGLRALPANGQALAVTKAAVAADVTQAGHVLLNLTPEHALHGVLPVDHARDVGDLVLGEVAGALLRIDLRLLAHLQRVARADPVQVAQADVNLLVVRNVDAGNAWHGVSRKIGRNPQAVASCRMRPLRPPG